MNFGIRTTRYKDIFDIYYLINKTDINNINLLKLLDIMIIKDKLMRENSIEDIVDNINNIINNKIFKQKLSDARNNWINVSIDELISNIIGYFKHIKED